MKKLLILLLVLAILGGGGYWYWREHQSSGTVFRTEEVARGKLVATIGATGTVMAREQVDVGAQVAGRIISIGKDPYTNSGIVDWGSEVVGPEVDKDGKVVLDKDGKPVKPGTLLAQIDPSLYQAQFNAATASLKAAHAALKSAQADVLVKTATLAQATSDWGRAQELFKSKGIAEAEYDQFKATFQTATANLEVSKANVDTATAQIGVQEANVKNAQTNLEYCTIAAPVTGTVIDRRVNVGQTVVASLSAPSLFLIAKDLTKMEVWAVVNEVDIDRIRVGQKVDFTVDSNPGRVYHGQVIPQGKLPQRLNANMTSNVVTYTVVVSANNDDLALKPYQTTNLSFIVADKDNALLVSNAALRWQPAKEQIAPDVRDKYLQSKNKKRGPTDPDATDHGVIWTQGADGFVHYLEIRTGLTDGVKTEVISQADGSPVPEGTRVIVGEEKKGAGGNGGNNPFSTQIFRGNSNKPKE